MTFIMITRFNNTTWEELNTYKKENGITGAFYGVPRRVAPTIPLKAKLIVLEMNNDTNTIMGVGLIKNFIKVDQVHPIYTWGNYHRFTYSGKRRIPRSPRRRTRTCGVSQGRTVRRCCVQRRATQTVSACRRSRSGRRPVRCRLTSLRAPRRTSTQRR